MIVNKDGGTFKGVIKTKEAKGTFKHVEEVEDLVSKIEVGNQDSKGYEFYKDGSVFNGTIRNSKVSSNKPKRRTTGW